MAPLKWALKDQKDLGLRGCIIAKQWNEEAEMESGGQRKDQNSHGKWFG